MSRFSKATKAKAKLRLALFGPAGSGKTFTALSVARGLGEKIALIDTERGSAAKYSDRFDFDTCDQRGFSIPSYLESIEEAQGYDVLIIDSLSHAWQWLVEEVDRIAAAKYRGNSWSAWSEGNPIQRKLIDAILGFPGHVLVTMRSKTEWTTAEDSRGRKTPQRVGLNPEQGKGIEFEFDVLMEMSAEHVGRVIKDRSGKFQDAIVQDPGIDFGKQMAAWLSDGVEPAPQPKAASKFKLTPGLAELLNEFGWAKEEKTKNADRVLNLVGCDLAQCLASPEVGEAALAGLNQLMNALNGVRSEQISHLWDLALSPDDA